MKVKINGIEHSIKLDHLDESIILGSLWAQSCDAKAERRRIALERAHLILAALFAKSHGDKGADVVIE